MIYSNLTANPHTFPRVCVCVCVSQLITLLALIKVISYNYSTVILGESFIFNKASKRKYNNNYNYVTRAFILKQKKYL